MERDLIHIHPVCWRVHADGAQHQILVLRNLPYQARLIKLLIVIKSAIYPTLMSYFIYLDKTYMSNIVCYGIPVGTCHFLLAICELQLATCDLPLASCYLLVTTCHLLVVNRFNFITLSNYTISVLIWFYYLCQHFKQIVLML